VAQSVYKIGHGLDHRGSILGSGNYGIFSLRHRIQTCSEAHPASFKMGSGGFHAGGKANHTPPSSAKIKEAWTYTSIPPIRLDCVSGA
jgi:hypothetical protein